MTAELVDSQLWCTELRNSSWNADYLHRGFITDRKITIPCCIATLIVSTISCIWITMPIPGKAFVTPPEIKLPQSNNLLWDEFEPREQIVLTKSIKLPREIFITFETEKNLSFWKATICYQLNYRRKNLKAPHLFEKFPCSESSCKWSRGSRYAFYQRMFFFTKTRKWFEAQHLLPIPVWRVKKLPTYQFISYSVIDCQKNGDQNYRACCCCCVLMSSWWELLGVGTDRISFVLSR